MQAPSTRINAVDTALNRQLANALRVTLDGSDASHVDNGPHWILCHLGEATRVRTLQPDMAAIATICEQQDAVGVSVFGRERDGSASMAVRAFCPADGIEEDPVTGSANAAIMAWLASRRDVDGYGLHYRASQGREVGRDGYVEVNRDAGSGAITIGGTCAIGIRGELSLPIG